MAQLEGPHEVGAAAPLLAAEESAQLRLACGGALLWARSRRETVIADATIGDR